MWFGLMGAAGFAQFMSFLVIATFVGAYQALRYGQQQQFSTTQGMVILALSAAVAIIFASHIYRTQMDTFFDPPKNPMPRKRWNAYATFFAATFGLVVAWTTFLIWLFVLVGLIMAGRLAFSFSGLPGHPLLWLVPVPAVLTLWAFVSLRHEVLKKLKTAQPPQLRLAADLRQHLDAFENAYEELAAFSKRVQGVIEAEQEQLQELRDQYRLLTQLIESSDRAPAIRTAIAQEQTRASRWGLMANVAVAAVFLAIGLLIDALVNTEALGHQLRHWLHLG
jgi:hypothetical protein